MILIYPGIFTLAKRFLYPYVVGKVLGFQMEITIEKMFIWKINEAVCRIPETAIGRSVRIFPAIKVYMKITHKERHLDRIIPIIISMVYHAICSTRTHIQWDITGKKPEMDVMDGKIVGKFLR